MPPAALPISQPLAPLAEAILTFWFTAGPHHDCDVWFRKDAAFDREIREGFGDAIAAGLSGAFGGWCTTPRGSLARVILLDQFTRNAFRGTPDAFAGDPRALATARQAVEREFDHALDPYERWFLYMPFVHSEALSMQERAVALFTALAEETGVDSPLSWTKRHRDVIARFGRFPHRNEILGRTSTPEERAFLEQPGSRF
ncbi:MAG TPA: DUF924 family protein [Rhodanobacteraceae bacterium]